MSAVETKTARRKRDREQRLMGMSPAMIALAEASARAARERVRAKLLLLLCSDYWVWEATLNRPVAPQSLCQCGHCRGLRKFPEPYLFVRSQWSYDCFLERHPPVPIDERGPKTEEQAEDHGLTVKKRRTKPQKQIFVLVSGCEGCDGLRPKGDRFCLACAERVRRQMVESGYLVEEM
jgi:hypothetical protein